MAVLTEGSLFCEEKKQYERFHVSKLGPGHDLQVLEVQSRVLADLQVKDSLQPLTEAEVETILNGKGLMIGVYVDGALIAFRALFFPGEHTENLGRDLDLSKEEQEKVVHQEITCVLPEYRGHGLQKKLGRLIMDELKRMAPRYRYVCCTVFPTNIASLKDKFSQSLLIAKVKEKYAGRIRYVLYQDLQRVRKLDEETISSAAITDYEQQKHLLEEGYYGFDLKHENNEQMILFAKFNKKE
ncbi:GNAT family N-acetyltransferase [Texcoconibacillus texcoconensis]|uniref:GNAT superfamily N-acetyltransferase n=1 Tax=Texcoconibacillus texcoconensis TaxID=1095777 RepID=A0A840QRU1_9BACI|nr:GNAT family N-acetyltransferase [Texcoconibacillus texcoconensis]MBB5174031.1 GNAT superfamily N-acetyltransferase [Texcoconibacillus texcoconensis]